MKIQKQQKETSQSLVYRFTKAVQKSGVLVEARKRKFTKRVKSHNLQQRAALVREGKKKEFAKLKKWESLKLDLRTSKRHSQDLSFLNMSIEDIKKDLIEAQKSKDEIKISVLRMVLSSIINKQKDKRLYVGALEPNLSDADLDRREVLDGDEIIEVLVSEAKKRRDSIFSFEEGGRQDLLEREQKELEILKKYLPVELTDEEIKKIVKEAIAKTGASGSKDIGILMKEVIPQTKGRADGYLVGKIVKEMLGN